MKLVTNAARGLCFAALLLSACGGASQNANQNPAVPGDQSPAGTPMLGLGVDPTAPKSPCELASAVVAERTKQTLAEASMDGEVARDMVEMLHRVVYTRCSQDGWSAPAHSCFSSASVADDPLVTCLETLTEEQRINLRADIEAEHADIRARYR